MRDGANVYMTILSFTAYTDAHDAACGEFAWPAGVASRHEVVFV